MKKLIFSLRTFLLRLTLLPIAVFLLISFFLPSRLFVQDTFWNEDGPTVDYDVVRIYEETQKFALTPRNVQIVDHTKTDENLWPSWWNSEKESRLLKEITIGIVTTKKFHPRITKYQMSSWWTKARLNIAEVFTDVTEDPTLPNLIYTHCDSSYHFGLWCKNAHMMKIWQTERYKDVKWFIRANDDSYYHLENIFEFLETLDPSVPQVIGDVYCYPPAYSYPAGGCGFIFSRAVLDQLDWIAWNNPLTSHLPLDDYWEDLQWGQYLADTNTRLIPHLGITQGPMIPNTTQTLKMILEYKDKPWPFKWRPLATHQAKVSNTLPELHRLLHSVEYYPDSPIKFSHPECTCRHGYAGRCQTNHSIPLKEFWNHPCRWEIPDPSCLGPDDYSAAAMEQMLKQQQGTKN